MRALRLRADGTTAIVLVTLLAALLRFPTLAVQSFGDAETFSVLLVRLDLGGMWDQIPELEGTPPLYYLVAWVWAKLFGSGEAGLRALSALVSTATVPVAWAAARTVVSARAALLAGVLVAVNPLLIWYGQEARAYALLGLLSAVALLFFLRAMTGSGRRGVNLAGWSIASALAVATHYFAALLVVPEAIWLLVALPRLPVLAASVPPLASGLALVPILLDQTGRAGGGETELASLGVRLARIPKQFLVGFNVPLEGMLTVVAAAAVVAAALLALRHPDRRGRAAVPAVIGVAGLALLVALALIGLDYVLSRYLVLLVAPLAIPVAAGLASARAGAVAALALVGVALVAVMAVNIDPLAQRPDYRDSMRRTGTAARAVVVSSVGARLEVFGAGLRPMPGAGRRVRVLDVIGLPVVGGEVRSQPRPATFAVPRRGFRLVATRRTRAHVILRYRAARPTLVSPLVFFRRHPGFDPAVMLYQPAAR